MIFKLDIVVGRDCALIKLKGCTRPLVVRWVRAVLSKNLAILPFVFKKKSYQTEKKGEKREKERGGAERFGSNRNHSSLFNRGER